MPDVHSIPFKQASGNGHYESKQLPNDKEDFLAILGLPPAIGNVTSVTSPSLDGQLATFWGVSGLIVKGSTAIGLVDLHDGVVTTKTTPTGEIVGTTAVQTLTNKTITNSTISGGITGLTKTDVGLGNVDNTSDANKPVSTAQQLALDLKEDKVNKGVVNGYASLDAGGKVPAAQLPTTVQGAVSYQGSWNASTNTPPIPTASTGNRGYYYVVSVAGTVLISGVASWGIGDWLVSNGTSWDKIDNTDAVASVAGKTGTVVLDRADVGLGNVDNTSDATKNSAAATLTNKTINGAQNSLSVRLDADVVNNLPVANLNNGIGATNQTWWCGDGQWKAPTGAGDVIGPAGAIDGEVALYGGATGKIIRRPVGTELLSAIGPSVWAVRQRSFNSIGNPNFEIDQRNVGAGVVNAANGAYLQDRWKALKVGTMTITTSRPAGSVVVPGSNFTVSSCNATVTLTTQQSSLAVGDYLLLYQTVEGSSMRELIGDVHSMSLLVRTSTAPLKFGVSLRDVGSTRSLCKLCTIPTANVWTLIPLANMPVWAAGGGWSVLPGVDGYTISITLACGATYMSPSNDNWQTGNFLGALGQDNFCAKTVNSTFQVAFVQHEPGADCSTLMDCSWNQNYEDCLRYFQKSWDYTGAVGSTSTNGIGQIYGPTQAPPIVPIRFPKPMAKVPTIVGYSSFNGQINAIYNYVNSTTYTGTPSNVGQTGFAGFTASPTPPAAVNLWGFNWTADTGW